MDTFRYVSTSASVDVRMGEAGSVIGYIVVFATDETNHWTTSSCDAGGAGVQWDPLEDARKPTLACDVVPRLSMLRALSAAPALSRRYAGLLHSSGPPTTKPRWTKDDPRERSGAGRAVGMARLRACAARIRARPSHASSEA